MYGPFATSCLVRFGLAHFARLSARLRMSNDYFRPFKDASLSLMTESFLVGLRLASSEATRRFPNASCLYMV